MLILFVTHKKVNFARGAPKVFGYTRHPLGDSHLQGEIAPGKRAPIWRLLLYQAPSVVKMMSQLFC